MPEQRVIHEQSVNILPAHHQQTETDDQCPEQTQQPMLPFSQDEDGNQAGQGIREAIYGHNQRDINQILENIVYLELLRRGYTVRIGKSNGKEIDFVAEKASQKIYIQVAYLIPDQTVAEREFSSLLTIQDNFPKMVLSLDRFDLSREGIIHKNLIDFLLDQGWPAELSRPENLVTMPITR